MARTYTTGCDLKKKKKTSGWLIGLFNAMDNINNVFFMHLEDAFIQSDMH